MSQQYDDNSMSYAFGDLVKVYRKEKGLSQQAIANKLQVHRNTIVKWERGDCLPTSKTMVLELARQLHLSSDDTRRLLEASLTAISPYWNVPYQRNPFFTGREKVLRQLARQLLVQQREGNSRSSALSGMGGIGKTQTVIEYAHRYGNEYAAVFWINAETTESVFSSVVSIAHLLELPNARTQEQGNIMSAVLRWLTSHRDWLLILDNVDAIEHIEKFLPSARQGTLLLTTRRQSLGITSSIYPLEPMTHEEGLSFLQYRTRLLQPFLSQNERSQEANSAAEELIHLLGGLPLALDQAGAYIDENGCQVEDYLHHYHSQRKKMLAYRGSYRGEHPASVYTTLQLSIGRIEQESVEAANLLRLCAFLHPEDVPEELFTTGAPHLRALLGAIATDAYHFDLAIGLLRNASLITRHAKTHTLSLHRLVQVVLQAQIEPADTHYWSDIVIDMINTAFPVSTPNSWPQCERFLLQALACASLAQSASEKVVELSELLFKAGCYLLDRGRNKEAKSLLGQAITLKTQQCGPESSLLIPWLQKQGEACWFLEEYEQAIHLLFLALHIGERQLGTTHYQVASILNDLATVFRDQEKYQQAEPLYQRALLVLEQQFGPNHVEVAEVLDCLAVLYWNQGEYEQAERLYQRAVRVQEQTLGLENLRTAVTLNNLATLYLDWGKYELAEPLYQHVLQLRESLIGTDHPGVATTMHWLAKLYLKQKKYQQAERLGQRALQIRERYVGPEHPKVAAHLNTLASLYSELEQHDQAISMYQRALLIYEHNLGSEHAQTRETRCKYISLLEKH